MKKLLSRLQSIFAKQDLTQGSILKGILVFLIPILLSTLFQQFYSLTDAAIVGQALSEESVAAINASSSINFIILYFGSGCTSGFSILMSRSVGANDTANAKKSFYAQIILSLLVSILLATAGIALIRPLLALMGIVETSGDPSMLKEFNEARTYLTYIIGASIMVVFYNLMAANLRAKGDSFAPFCFLTLSVILNIGLDFLFIYAFKMGVAGSALATVLSQGVAAICSIIYAVRKYEEFNIHIKKDAPSIKYLLEHVKNGLPLGFQFSIIGFGIIAMTSGVVSFDVYSDGTTIANLPAQLGYGAACKIINFLMCPLQALGMAMLSFTSQNYGAKNARRLIQGVKVGSLLGIIITLIINIIGFLLLINGAYQYIFLSPDKINESSIFFGNTYLIISMPCMIFLMMVLLFRNIQQGLEKPFIPFLAGIIELFARIFMCTLLPLWVYGKLSAESPIAAYYMVLSGDWVAWLAGGIVMLLPLIFSCKKLIKTIHNPAK